MRTPRSILAPLTALVLASPALAWDAHGHRMVTLLALDALITIDKPAPGAKGAAADGETVVVMPQWLMEGKVRDAIAYQCAEPDRIRAQPLPQLVHIAAPDHYLDIEMLAKWDLTLENLPKLRYQFIKAMALAREKHPERFADYKPEADKFNEHEWPGFVPYAVLETYGNLEASFRTIKIIETLGVSGREAQLEQAKQNAIYFMGKLAHLIGDIAQPLHTTVHHHGWVGPNPNGYTTDNAIHSWIDGGAIATLKIDYPEMTKQPVVARKIDIDNPWNDIIEEMKRSNAKVEELYKLQLDDKFTQPEGKAFLEERIRDGASVLAAMYRAAWLTSDPVKQDFDFFTYGTPPSDKPSLPNPPKRQPAKNAADSPPKRAAN